MRAIRELLREEERKNQIKMQQGAWATQKIEELILELKGAYTIAIVTHNMQQAARVSEFTAFFWLGKLVEFNTTERIFTAPDEQMTEDYVTGRFG